MGKRGQSIDQYLSSASARPASSNAFSYSKRTIASGGKIHPALNPAYGGFRYSKDPGDGKETVSITVALDVTGSNADNARQLWDKLPKMLALMNTALRADGHLNMQLAFVGDAYTDDYPLQLSQFESGGDIIEKWLNLAVLEGGGGGQAHESYELMLWALVNQNNLDAWTRGEKGKLIVIFDEMPYNHVSVSQLEAIYNNYVAAPKDDGVAISAMQQSRSLDEVVLPRENITIEDMARQVQEKYDCWFIICGQSSYYRTEETIPIWRELFGPERVIKLEDPNDIAECAAGLVAMNAGISRRRVTEQLQQLGAGDSVIKTLLNVSTSIVPTTNSNIQVL